AENAAAPSLDLLKAALREAGSAEAESRVGLLQKVREDLRAVEDIFRSRAAGGQTPDIEKLDTTLAHGIAFLETGIERAGPAQADDVGVMTAAADGGASASGPGLGALRSRE